MPQIDIEPTDIGSTKILFLPVRTLPSCTDFSSAQEVAESFSVTGGEWEFDTAWLADSLIDFQNRTEVEKRFHELAGRWRRETRGMSTMLHKAMNDHYLDIIGMGPVVVPYILQDLEQKADHWFVALQHLTRTDPVPKEDRGNIEKMRAAWLEWGRRESEL